MLGNPQLDPEVNNQLDLTFEWRTKGSQVNVDLFVSYLQDYISSLIDTSLSPRLPMSPGVRQYVNIDKAIKTGFEISWVQNLPLGMQHQMGLAYTYAQDIERDEALPEIPPIDLRYALSGKYFKGRLVPEVMFRYVAEQSRVSQEFGETITPTFALLDVKMAYHFSDKFSVAAGVNNVFDKNYYEHLNRSVRGTSDPIYARGRNVFANLSVRF
jgi:iron complex outermembrane receptor protein